MRVLIENLLGFNAMCTTLPGKRSDYLCLRKCLNLGSAEVYVDENDENGCRNWAILAISKSDLAQQMGGGGEVRMAELLRYQRVCIRLYDSTERSW